MMDYPQAHDTYVLARPEDIARGVMRLQRRVGTLQDTDAASLEDRLFTVENLLADIGARLFSPPGQGRK